MVVVSSVSVIFDTRYTYSFYSNKGYFVKLEEKTFPRNIKGISKGLEIYGNVFSSRFTKYPLLEENE